MGAGTIAWIVAGAYVAAHVVKCGLDIRRARRDAARLIDAAVQRVVWNNPAAVDGLSPKRRARAKRWLASLRDETEQQR